MKLVMRTWWMHGYLTGWLMSGRESTGRVLRAGWEGCCFFGGDAVVRRVWRVDLVDACELGMAWDSWLLRL